jgi:hypothetical protein
MSDPDLIESMVVTHEEYDAPSSSIGASLIRPGSFSGYQQKVPCSLERWHFHLLRREEVSPEALLRQIDREG